MSEAGLFDEKLLNSALAEADAQHNRIVNRSTGSYDEDLGNSPDGIGYLNIAQPPKQLRAPVQGAGPMYPNPPPPQFQAQHGELSFIEPEDTSDNAAITSAGLTIVAVTAGTAIGYALKGSLGAISGLLFSGAAANLYRAQKWWKSPNPSNKHEAIVSTVFGIGGIVAGGFLVYQLMQENSEESRKDDE